MFNFFRRLKKLEKIFSVNNESARHSVFRPSCSIANHTESHAEEEATEVAEPIKETSKKKKRLNATRNLSLKEIADLPRDELITMIIKLDTHNQDLKNIIQKSAQTDKKYSDRHNIIKQWDLENSFRRHILLKLCYLGWDYQGYVVQDDSPKTVEHHLFNALKKVYLIESRQTSNYHLCGRTDRGVSALHQVISIDVRSKVIPEDQLTQSGIKSEINYCALLNSALPKEIRCIAWRPLATPDYSARYDCVDRTYKYYFPRGNLDVTKMNEACKILVGTHNFRNFCKLDLKNGVTRHTRRLDSLEIKVASINSDQLKEFDTLYLEIKGWSFLRNMVRRIVTILMLVGQHTEPPEIVTELLDADTNHKPDYALANELPLILFDCNHRNDHNEGSETNELLNNWIVDEKSLSKVIRILQDKWIRANAKSTMVFEMMKKLRQEHYSRFPNHQLLPIYHDKRRVKYEKVSTHRQESSTLENS